MPGGDGTGPNGMGGWCTPLWKSGQIEKPIGGGGRGSFGRRASGMGSRGRGRMNRFYATGEPMWVREQQPLQQPSKEQELAYLEQQIENIKKRIEELKK